ncbi:hypothetical protein [Hymenobacter cheonanensis]|uniref:hypothetical protein n=1 Tax=Hymenobacter sp. CA2-7 TaxID=3063993 RepID=UPI002712B71C|nr:hypothetical protein [Hymenobacter sp. CA2-7]MDO7884606.1 hypothetical protein [Hymenobacter sp. CA2-7]
MKSLPLLAAVLLAPLGLLAQTTPPAKPAPAATAAPAQTTPAPLALAPVTPAPDPNALKIKVDQNPIAHTLTVRCDAPGPTRFEINDKEGRPVLTKTAMVGTTPLVMKVGTLPAGPYVVRCTAGEKRGTKLVQLQ